MALNLRLQSEAEEALRAEAQRSGRSQQEILRDAVDRYLGLSSPSQVRHEWDQLITSGKVLPPRGKYRKVMPTKRLPEGLDSLDLLDRSDRL